MSEQRQGRFARGLTLLVTTIIKLVGLASAAQQLLFTPSPRALPLIIAAFMMAGAQFSEGLVLSILDRVFMAHQDSSSEARR
jgi:hypothetical protein